MKVIVTGASGWIGSEVCRYLTSQNIEVIGFDLSKTKAIEGITSDFFPVDLTKEFTNELDSLQGKEAVSDVSAVIHCAGYAHRPNETQEEQSMFYAVNRDGTQRMIDWCEKQGIRRFLYISSIAFYDWKSKTAGPVNEDHPVALHTHYAKSKYEGEQIVSLSNLDWRIARLATVFGENDPANFSRMARMMKKHLFIIPGEGSAKKSVIPVSLVAKLLVEFAIMDNPPHNLINVATPAAPTLRQIANAYKDICGFPGSPSIPMSIVKGLAFCGDCAAKLLGKFPFTSTTLSKLTTSTEVSVTKMLECFPKQEFHSFEDYLEECRDYYKSI